MTPLWKLLNSYESISMKQVPGRDMVIYGSASTVRTLTNLGLIGRYQCESLQWFEGAASHSFQTSCTQWS